VSELKKQPRVKLKCVHCPYEASGTMEATVKAAMVDHYATVHGPDAGKETPSSD
jgi:hypothetical protein